MVHVDRSAPLLIVFTSIRALELAFSKYGSLLFYVITIAHELSQKCHRLTGKLKFLNFFEGVGFCAKDKNIVVDIWWALC